MSAATHGKKSTSFVSPAKRNTKVSSQHTLDRVRNNQRRHRERRRDHITTLEIRLSEAETEMKSLHKQIATLKRGLQNCRCGAKDVHDQSEPSADDSIPSITYLHTGDGPTFTPFTLPDISEGSRFNAITSSVDRPALSISPDLAQGLVISSPTAYQPISSSISSSSYPSAPCLRLQTDQSCTFQTRSTNPHPKSLARNILLKPYNDKSPAQSSANQLGNTMPLPYTYQPERLMLSNSQVTSNLYSASPIDKCESTILCKRAYELVLAQNYREMSQENIKSWLSPGFTWPCITHITNFAAAEAWGDESWSEEIGEEVGCRVETVLLFGLLAFISDM